MIGSIFNANFTRKLIPPKNVGQIQLNVGNPRWFAETYQEKRVYKKNSEYYTLRTLMLAMNSSEELFRQYDIDDTRAKKLATSIFLNEGWLMEDVVLAICQSSSDRYYIVGGRHRLTAIAATIYQVVTAKYTNEDTISDLLDAALDQEIRCNVVYLTELDDLIKLIKSNNDSRKMRKFEDKHMDIQKEGADPDSIESVGETIFNIEAKPAELCEYGAQNFVRRESRLKPQTLYTHGVYLACWALYGLSPTEKLKTTSPMVVSTPTEFNQRMELAWQVFCEKTSGMSAVASNVKQTCIAIVIRLMQMSS
ncbi:hypothetical protein [Chroococcidiopsis sp. CCMEE 29]|uniref:hypothetical protein n=1 Tax=Chroococcidiopsis sp. CCMEE 29 TaxID=155894 RepID=UPI002021FF5F|nr:hypothetical protein [Chroococcidiopsis sp. CCMEE 29]